MIQRFPSVDLPAIGATASHGGPALPSTFQAKTIHSRTERTSSYVGEERGLRLYSFMDMRRTATRGPLWPQI
jgi:hypothetical protein